MKRDWLIILLVLVGVPSALCATVVVGLVWHSGKFPESSMFYCSPKDGQLADSVSKDPAAEALIDAFPDGPEPSENCDPDDRTVSVVVELTTGLDEEQALTTGRQALERNGWRRSGSCYSKQIEGKTLWASLTYRDEFRSQLDGDLLLAVVSAQDRAR